MNRKGGPLSPQEAELWNRVAATVEPLEKRVVKAAVKPKAPPPANIFSHKSVDRRPTQKQFANLISPTSSSQGSGVTANSGASLKASTPNSSPKREGLNNGSPQGLDSHWNRRFVRGRIEPDITVDLHGHTLSTAYTQLDQSLALAIGAGFRVILLITGKARSEDARDGRGNRRGVIRAAVADWLAASRHASSIAAVRNAHPKHGGNGALYIVLKR